MINNLTYPIVHFALAKGNNILISVYFKALKPLYIKVNEPRYSVVFSLKVNDSHISSVDYLLYFDNFELLSNEYETIRK